MMEVYWSEFAGRPQVKRGKMTAEYFQQRYAQQIAEYLSGTSSVGIAAVYGGHARAWCRRFHRAGVKVRSRNGPHANPGRPKGPHRGFVVRNEEIVAARLAGGTLQAIADRYEMTRERVRQIVKKANPVYAVTGKQMRSRLCKEETQQRRVRPCKACGKPFSVANPKQKHCSKKCGCGASRIDEQKHRDALAARVDGIGWKRIGMEIYGYGGTQPNVAAQQAFIRWAERTGYDISWLRHK